MLATAHAAGDARTEKSTAVVHCQNGQPIYTYCETSARALREMKRKLP